MFTLGKRVEITEEPITDKDGRHHVLSTTKVPLRDARGVITHLVGIIHDITPLKRAEEALREVSNVLERRMQERTDELLAAQTELVRRERLAVIGLFAGSLAHQIRNPLGSIKNAAYLVQLASPTVDDDLRRALNIIQDEVGRANQIITDLVDYARVTPAQRRVVPVDLLMEIALSGMDLPANVTVVTECPALPKVFVDPAQLQRALQKLVKNALQAMSNGGTLTLRARSEGDAVFFCVSDTGRGIPEDVRHRLFEPLVSGNPGNLGLGLITARALIENQGGALALEKTDHDGTCVMLRLPVASE
jgi:signal transduction histidine kinase